MKNNKLTYLIFIFSVLLLLLNNTPGWSAVFTDPFEENEELFQPSLEIEDPSLQADKLIESNFGTFGWTPGSDEDEFGDGAGENDTTQYNDMPPGEGTWALLLMALMYIGCKMLLRKFRNKI